jgi:hypothetical protein
MLQAEELLSDEWLFFYPDLSPNSLYVRSLENTSCGKRTSGEVLVIFFKTKPPPHLLAISKRTYTFNISFYIF